jgi:hypothetical protein
MYTVEQQVDSPVVVEVEQARAEVAVDLGVAEEVDVVEAVDEALCSAAEVQ